MINEYKIYANKLTKVKAIAKKIHQSIIFYFATKVRTIIHEKIK